MAELKTPFESTSIAAEDKPRLKTMVTQFLNDARARRYQHDMEVETTGITIDQIKSKKFVPGSGVLEQVEQQNAVAIANRQQADNQIAVYERRLKELDA